MSYLAKTALTGAMILTGVAAAQAENAKVVFGTNWLAQAEHGGFYQSVADGTYAECGLDVEIVSGGPQVNNRALLLAGRIDYHMGGDLLDTFNAAREEIPVVLAAAIFQKHPQVLLTHPGKAETFEDLKDLELLIGDNGFSNFYQWMISAYGFTVEQRRPYTYNSAPFISNENSAMQGFLSSEPFAIEKEAGFKPNVFLIADAGYSSYSTSIEVMRSTIEEKPEQVQCFVDGSIKGWYNYLYGDNTAANEMIKAANPDITDEKLAYAHGKMKSEGIVDSGDALEMGIGAVNEQVISDFYAKVVEAGVVEDGLDWSANVTDQFVNKKVGMDLKPAN
ncbi:ABC transporter substrate-binding protein [Oceaniglobus ichthyenteri]|uniref:ABC transporter substrate-binding protein n=1 Tax=Oceaniglobus ichthyenteri TaxID=2136177 RepID=UPI000D35E4B0|nr:ABC transporter substrate-binding protein [Oceaniglobus ichthyenteri]